MAASASQSSRTGPSELAQAVSPRFEGGIETALHQSISESQTVHTARAALRALEGHVDESIDDALWKIDVHLGAAEHAHAKWYDDFEDPVGRETVVHAAISDIFNMLGTAAVTLFVVLFVLGMIVDTMDFEEDNAIANESENIEGTTADALALGAVMLIVLVAAGILWLVRGFGGNGDGPGGNGRR